MFPSPAKLAVIILVVFAVWYALRWLNRTPPTAARRPQAQSPPPRAAIEDLVACRACGTFVAAGARNCGKAGCPQPR
jgi:hypothetical protein